jgi:DNA-binding XRE family transcriptional regulator
MIYFIGSEYLIKIGFTDHIQERIDSFESDIPFDFEVFGIIEGDEIKEQYLHHVFKEFHVNREWFTYCQPIIDYVHKHKIEVPVKRRIRHKRDFSDLKKIRLSAGYTMKSAAELLNWNPATVYKVECKYPNDALTLKTLKKYLSIFNYEVVIKQRDGENKRVA